MPSGLPTAAQLLGKKIEFFSLDANVILGARHHLERLHQAQGIDRGQLTFRVVFGGLSVIRAGDCTTLAA